MLGILMFHVPGFLLALMLKNIGCYTDNPFSKCNAYLNILQTRGNEHK
jgi:hypothetical protein